MYLWTLAGALFLLVLGGLLADGGALFLRHAAAERLATGAAHAAAMEVDVAALRAAPDACPRLDPAAAHEAAARYLSVARGNSAIVDATPDWVVVEVADVARPTLLAPFGARAADVRARAVARPRVGTDTERPECRR